MNLRIQKKKARGTYQQYMIPFRCIVAEGVDLDEVPSKIHFGCNLDHACGMAMWPSERRLDGHVVCGTRRDDLKSNAQQCRDWFAGSTIFTDVHVGDLVPYSPSWRVRGEWGRGGK